MRLSKIGLVVLSALVFTGCSAAMTSSTSHSDQKPLAQWPLRFSIHSFLSVCYDTLSCSVSYAGHRADNDTPTQSSASIGSNYQDAWTGTHGMIPNFAPPAEVRWRSRDGELHEARIDIGEIFRDQLIRHRVPREELPENTLQRNVDEPSIILEVNDRTIRVYMRATIPTKELQIPGNRYSQFRDDLILVRTFNY